MTDAQGTAPDFAGEDFDPVTGARDMIDLGPKREPREIPHRPLSEAELSEITGKIVEALKTVYDPEIPVDVYELGLIYKVDYDPAEEAGQGGKVAIEMTLTAPGCPVAGEMPGWVETAVRRVDGIEDVSVEMTFDPPWTAERMSDEAKLELGWM